MEKAAKIRAFLSKAKPHVVNELKSGGRYAAPGAVAGGIGGALSGEGWGDRLWGGVAGAAYGGIGGATAGAGLSLGRRTAGAANLFPKPKPKSITQKPNWLIRQKNLAGVAARNPFAREIALRTAIGGGAGSLSTGDPLSMEGLIAGGLGAASSLALPRPRTASERLTRQQFPDLPLPARQNSYRYVIENIRKNQTKSPILKGGKASISGFDDWTGLRGRLGIGGLLAASTLSGKPQQLVDINEMVQEAARTQEVERIQQQESKDQTMSSLLRRLGSLFDREGEE